MPETSHSGYDAWEESMIQLQHVSHTYPNGAQALKNLSLELSADRFTAPIGASGTGKSTVMRILNALVKPSSGSVLIDGLELSIGSLGKLISESIESVDMGQVEAVKATGAHPLQITSHGFWPQVLPLFISYTLYRFEINVRAATILGIVGAGGIGFYLQEAMRTFSNKNTSTILLIIIVSVFIIDSVSSRIRKRII
ncbi:MAG: ABC transporter permease subunit [Trueperaceae bacterium]|nr:ABC transporter permease subunit [Trueperaceae bacterium]